MNVVLEEKMKAFFMNFVLNLIYFCSSRRGSTFMFGLSLVFVFAFLFDTLSHSYGIEQQNMRIEICGGRVFVRNEN
ncbi:hypothetical protein L6452_37119 [Arctium lappa]|uniref:Uncharacterized protein n=1 Tax=Arctium lappa TaxID=4217 RepID=A0ACB8Y3M2_ARCLA|nr:hypothetical protein L6452_37119 [Arctium lappa]